MLPGQLLNRDIKVWYGYIKELGNLQGVNISPRARMVPQKSGQQVW